MFYTFPKIENIDDVLPHVEGRKEFIVAERDFGTVINYVVATPETFEMKTSILSGSIRRECRGIIFDKMGALISRPFHKFFNIGEREETFPVMLDFTRAHMILEKADGSMVRPLLIGGNVVLGTKMGITDIGTEASKILTDDQSIWLRDMVLRGKTPIMEYVAPSNKIVVQYDQPRLILLAIRDTVSGNYEELPIVCPIEVIHSYGSMDLDLALYLEKTRKEEGREGDIIRWHSGHMVKNKNNWYVRIHKVKDKIRFERNICDIIINEQLDDLLPILDEVDRKTVLDFQERFNDYLSHTLHRLEQNRIQAEDIYGGDRKRVALEMIPNLKHREDSVYIFAALDGKDIRNMLIKNIRTAVTNTTRYDKLMDWISK